MSREANKAPGADCTYCALRSQPFCPDEIVSSRPYAIVGESPGGTEVKFQKPFVGPSGQELVHALGPLGLSRADFSVLNVCSCRPKNNRLADARTRAAKIRRAWERECKLVDAELPRPLGSADPVTCCAGRLALNLQKTGSKNLLALGGTAFQALTGSNEAISNVRGFAYVTDTGTKVFPSLHPAFVLRSRRWRKVFAADCAKAERYFNDQLTWQDPERIYNPKSWELAAFLAADGVFAYDLETDGLDPLECRIRCLSICRDDWRAVCIGFRSCEAGMKHDNGPFASPWYAPDDFHRILLLLRHRFEHLAATRRLLGFNSGYFDRQVLLAEFERRGVPFGNFALHDDTILRAKLADPELPHSLGLAGSFLTDVYAWKSENTATSAKTDQELWDYNVTDTAVNIAIDPILKAEVDRKAQAGVYEKDLQLQNMCVGLHETGMLIDQAVRARLAAKYEKEAAELLGKLRELTGRKDFNPASNGQVATLLYDDLDLTPVAFSEKTGSPSTGAKSLIKLLRDVNATDEVRSILNGIRRWRRVEQKYLGTYLRPAGALVGGEPFEVDDGDEVLLLPRGWLSKDGRAHASWSSHSVLSGRLSCSQPVNLQTLPKELREMFVPAPGRVYVSGDEAQLELRIIVAYSQARGYLEDLAAGRDPHARQGEAIFGKAYTDLKDGSTEKSRLRRFTKEFQYASFYGATEDTIHAHLTAAEGKDGSLVFNDLKLGEVVVFRLKWLAANPEIETWWSRTQNQFRRHKYLTEPLWGRRRDFTDEVGVENEVLNFRVQACGAAIVNDATFELLEKATFHKWGPSTGLVNQSHDSLLFEVPEAKAEPMRKLLARCMTRRYDQLPNVEFTCETAISKSWLKAA